MTQARRRQIVVNKNFQYRFAFYVCAWIFMLCISYPYILSTLFDYFVTYFGAELNQKALQFLQLAKTQMIFLLLVIQVIVLALAFFLSLVLSHRMIGPLTKLMRFMKEAPSGKLDQELSFRKNDFFQDIPPAFNSMLKSFTEKIADRQNSIDLASHKIETLIQQTQDEGLKGELQSILTELKDHQ